MIAHGVVATEETDCNRKQGPCSTEVQWLACLPSKQDVRVRIPCIAPYILSVTVARLAPTQLVRVRIFEDMPIHRLALSRGTLEVWSNKEK